MEVKSKGFVSGKEKNWRKKGSCTVEASLLLPLLTGVIFMCIILSLYLHDRSVLSACAAELAGKGAARKYETKEHLENWLAVQAEGLAEDKLLLLWLTAVSAEVTGSQVTVSYEGRTELLGGLEVKEEETARRLNPADYIRSSRRLKHLTGQEQ